MPASGARNEISVFERWMPDFRLAAGGMLRLIAQPLLVPMRLHAFAALMLGNFRFASFLERAHSDCQIREARFNHQMHCNATRFSRCGMITPLTSDLALP
jgi:hypothetical protein